MACGQNSEKNRVWRQTIAYCVKNYPKISGFFPQDAFRAHFSKNDNISKYHNNDANTTKNIDLGPIIASHVFYMFVSS